MASPWEYKSEHAVQWGQETLEERIEVDRRAYNKGTWPVCRGQGEASVARAHRTKGCGPQQRSEGLVEARPQGFAECRASWHPGLQSPRLPSHLSTFHSQSLRFWLV